MIVYILEVQCPIQFVWEREHYVREHENIIVGTVYYVHKEIIMWRNKACAARFVGTLCGLRLSFFCLMPILDMVFIEALGIPVKLSCMLDMGS